LFELSGLPGPDYGNEKLRRRERHENSALNLDAGTHASGVLFDDPQSRHAGGVRTVKKQFTLA
jgi:hypothetical protein